MGFSTKDKLYHGTPEENISSFKPSPHDETHIKGVAFARDPQTADFYARGRSFADDAENANIIPVWLQGKKPQDFDKFTDYAIDKNLFSNKTLDVSKPALDYAEKKNLAGFDHANMYGDEIQVVNPERIRSTFAAFDPFRKTAATAAAMGVAAPDLLAQELRKK